MKTYEPTSEWYVLAFALPLVFLIIPWTRPFMVKGDKLVVGLAKFPSFRRYAISVNDIQKIDLWCWPPPEVDLSDTSQEFWLWQAVRRRYSMLIIYIWDKNGKKYKNFVTNIAIFKGLVNKMKEQGLLSPGWIKTLPPILIPEERDRNVVMPTLVTDIVEDMIGTVGHGDRKPPPEFAGKGEKECPYCKKIIVETVIRCKYCRKVLPDKAKNI